MRSHRRSASGAPCRGCLKLEDMTQLQHPDSGATVTAVTEKQAAALERLGWQRQGDGTDDTPRPSTSRPSKQPSAEEEAPPT